MKLKDEGKEQAIVEKTLDIVHKKGLSGLKMAELAKKVDISPSTLYVYFKNKEDLIVSIGTGLFQQWLKDEGQAPETNLPYKLRLKKKWLNFVQFGLSSAKEMSFISQIKQSTYINKIPEEIMQAKYKMGHDLIELGKSEGLIKNIDNMILMSIIGSFSTETVRLINEKQLKLNDQDMDLMFSILWDAIKS